MSVKKNEKTLTPTIRQCIHFVNAVDELKSRGGFYFRLAIASLTMEAKRRVEIFNEHQKPSKGITSFQEEIKLHRENCTTEKDGKKTVDTTAFMVLYEEANMKHAKAIADAEKLQETANKALEDTVEIYCKPITMELLQEADNEEKFSAMLFAALLPFVEQKD